MLNRQILVSARARTVLMVCLAAAGTAGLVACGQRGPLFQPTDPAAAQRATLPQLLKPSLGGTPSAADAAAPAPAAASSAPAPAKNATEAPK